MSECKVVRCSKGITHIELEGYSFDLRDRTLIQINVDNPSVDTVIIPNKLPSGHKIDVIASVDLETDFVNQKQSDKVLCLKKLVIDDCISLISEEAFAYAYIKEIHWPKACSVIPYKCFADSEIETISGIECVRTVSELAFSGSNIKTIKWPLKCKSIPEGCFVNSSLESISNVENVTDVGFAAFAASRLKEAKFTQPYCNIGISAFFDCNPDTVTLPFFISSEDYEDAFSDTVYRDFCCS